MATPPLSPYPTHLDRLSVGPYGTPDVDGTILQLTAIDGAFLLPNMTAAQATAAFSWSAVAVAAGPPTTAAIPANLDGNSASVPGMMIYITDPLATPVEPFMTQGLYYFNGFFPSTSGPGTLPGAWQRVAAGPA